MVKHLPMIVKSELKTFSEMILISSASSYQQELVVLELIFKKQTLWSYLTQIGIHKSIFKRLIELIELVKREMLRFTD